MQKVYAYAVLLALTGCGSSTASQPEPASAPARAPATPAKPAGPSTDIPSLGLRIGCEGKVSEMKDAAMVLCPPVGMAVVLHRDARTIDDAIAAHDAERTHMLEAGKGVEARAGGRYRHAYENKGGAGTNYWVDVILEIEGRIFVCQTGSLGPNGTRENANRGGDICETLTALPRK